MDLVIGKRYEKSCRFKQTETKENVRNGVPVGIIEGLASTYELDRGDDIIVPGAFAKTLNRHSAEGRPVRMLLQHQNGELIGGFPIEFAKETPEGLFVRGEINLEVQRGREAYALAKQDVLTDMSIGFSIPSREAVDYQREGDRVLRLIKEVELWEISLVSEPMNPGARVQSVKSAASLGELPIANRSTPWDMAKACERVKELTGSADVPSESYRDAFLSFDVEKSGTFEAYSLPIADVVDGALVAVPRGIFSAAAALVGARSCPAMSETEKADAIATVERYYKKMDLESPFGKKSVDSTICEACDSLSDVENLLKLLGISSEGRKILISRIKSTVAREESGVEDKEKEAREDASFEKDIALKLDRINESLLSARIEKSLNRIR